MDHKSPVYKNYTDKKSIYVMLDEKIRIIAIPRIVNLKFREILQELQQIKVVSCLA